MAQRRHHYERAFEAYLRQRRIPYVAVDEARKALLPEGATFRVSGAEGEASLKSFDFVLYAEERNLLVDIKGRRVTRRSWTASGGRLESWVTHEDVDSLHQWQALFGPGFESAFVFVYWCDEQPPDGLFQEVLEYQARWYALRAISLDQYAKHMKQRSARWRTVDLPTRVFEQVSQPFAPAWVDGRAGSAPADVPAPGPVPVQTQPHLAGA